MLCIRSVFISIITLSINTEKTISKIFCDVIKQSDKVKKKKKKWAGLMGIVKRGETNLHAQEIVRWVKGQKKWQKSGGPYRNTDNDPNSYFASNIYAICVLQRVRVHVCVFLLCVSEITASLPGCPVTTSASCFTTATLQSPPTPLILLKAIHNKHEILGSGVQTLSSPFLS